MTRALAQVRAAVAVILASMAQARDHDEREAIARELRRLEGTSARQTLAEMAARSLEEARDNV